MRIVLGLYLGCFGDFSVITEIQWGSVTPSGTQGQEQSLRPSGG